MKPTNVLFPSPTPPGFTENNKSVEFSALSARIAAVCSIYRSTIAEIQISAIVDKPDNPGVLQPLDKIVINLSELPDELREGLHNYATRLVAEKHVLKAQALINKL